MQLMAGLERPTSGEVWFRGQNVTGVPVQKRNVAMVYQQFINYPNFTVYENIASPLRVAGMPAGEIEPRVKSTAELLRLAPMLDRRPNELSGGQQQRTAIARALVKDSDLILLDEPLANLDYKLREELARRAARSSSPAATASSSMPPPSRSRRCCSAATPRRCMRAGSPSSARPRRSTASPVDLVTARRLLRPADQYRAGDQARRRDPSSATTIQLARRQGGAADPRRRVHHRHPPASHHAAARKRQRDDRGPVLVTELSGSESVVHFDLIGQHLGVAVARHPPLRGRVDGAGSMSMSTRASSSAPTVGSLREAA